MASNAVANNNLQKLAEIPPTMRVAWVADTAERQKRKVAKRAGIILKSG